MIVFFGTRLYGKVDQVPGLFHMAKEFFYIQFIPLFPSWRSYLVLQPHGRAVQLSISGKSVLFTYFRMALCIGAAVGLTLGIIDYGEHLAGKRELSRAIAELAVGVVCVPLFFLTYRLSRPTPLRAYKLAMKAGLPLEVLVEHYAQILTPEQLEDLARRVGPTEENSPQADSSL
jgi:hypothetical protein